VKLISNITKMQEISEARALEKKRIGFVPTMGYLHQGHLQLVEKSVADNEITVASVFVNPTQFGPEEDYDEYPRDLDRDLDLLQERGVDYVLYPDVEDVYPEGFATYVQVEKGTDVLCGRSRPNHFKGVTTVVSKLFNMVKPHRAYFGQKDGQQLLIIRRMVQDLNMDIEVVACPTVREEDGLALSSRNKYLSPEEREAALIIYNTLQKTRERIEEGERDGWALKKAMEEAIKAEPLANLDYASIVSRDYLQELSRIEGPIMIAIAAFIGSTRLIDNVWLEVE